MKVAAPIADCISLLPSTALCWVVGLFIYHGICLYNMYVHADALKRRGRDITLPIHWTATCATRHATPIHFNGDVTSNKKKKTGSSFRYLSGTTKASIHHLYESSGIYKRDFHVKSDPAIVLYVHGIWRNVETVIPSHCC